jgi:hypothetical protein
MSPKGAMKSPTPKPTGDKWTHPKNAFATDGRKNKTVAIIDTTIYDNLSKVLFRPISEAKTIAPNPSTTPSKAIKL